MGIEPTTSGINRKVFHFSYHITRCVPKLDVFFSLFLSNMLLNKFNEVFWFVPRFCEKSSDFRFHSKKKTQSKIYFKSIFFCANLF